MLTFTAVMDLPSSMNKDKNDCKNFKLYVIYKGASDKWISIKVIVRALTSFHFNVFFLKKGLICLATALYRLVSKKSFLTR